MWNDAGDKKWRIRIRKRRAHGKWGEKNDIKIEEGQR